MNNWRTVKSSWKNRTLKTVKISGEFQGKKLKNSRKQKKIQKYKVYPNMIYKFPGLRKQGKMGFPK